MPLQKQQLVHFLEEKFGLDPAELAEDTPLFSSQMIDSFAMVDLLMFIEDASERKLSPTDVNLDNLDSIGRILQFLDS